MDRNIFSDLKKLVLVFVLLSIVTGCAGIGYMSSKEQNFTGKYSMLLQVPRADILNIITEAGKSLGYSVSAIDKEAKTISLSSSGSGFTTFLIGKTSQATLTISSKNNGRRLDIDVFVIGNFGTGGQKAAMKLVKDFEAKLLEKIGQ